jgi:hypothetical protein
MAKASLVERDLQTGARLIQALDEAAFPIEAAFWLFDPEPQHWHLVIASSVVNEEGPRPAYAKIREVMQNKGKYPDLMVDDTTVRRTDDPMIKPLRKAISTSSDLTPIRIARSSFNNVYIDDAYVYRVRGSRQKAARSA